MVKSRGVDTSRHGHQPDTLGNGRADHLVHTVCGLHIRKAQRRSHVPSQGPLGSRGVQGGPASQEIAGVQVSQRQAGVSDRGPHSTPAIAGRARVGTRAFRADMQDPTLVHPGDAAAASAQGMDIDHRRRNLPPCLELLVGNVRHPVLDQRDVRAGAAHVEGDQLVEATCRPIRLRPLQQLPDVRRCAHPSRRARQDGPHRHPAGVGYRGHSTVGLHDQHVIQLRVRFEPLAKVREIAAEHRADVGVDHRGAEAVEFLYLWNHLVGEGGVHVGEALPDDFRRPLLVGGIEVREQEADGQGFRPFADQVLQALHQRGLVQRAYHLTVGPYALRDAHPQVAGRQRLHHLHPQVVAVLLQPFPHLQQVAEAVGGEQANGGALALHQRIGSDGRPVNHQVRLPQELLQ